MRSAVLRTPLEENKKSRTCAASSPFCAAVAHTRTGGKGTPILEIGAVEQPAFDVNVQYFMISGRKYGAGSSVLVTAGTYLQWQGPELNPIPAILIGSYKGGEDPQACQFTVPSIPCHRHPRPNLLLLFFWLLYKNLIKSNEMVACIPKW